MNTFIKLIYSILIAGSVVAFIGVGVFSFYQPPKPPHFPEDHCTYPTSTYPTSQEQTAYEKCEDNYSKASDAANKKQDTNNKHYQRNVAIIVLPMALASLLVGIVLIRRSSVIGEGLALGGAGSSIYAIITASIGDARIPRFLGVTLLLVSILLVAHFRFAGKPRSS